VTRWNDLVHLAGEFSVRQTEYGIEPIRVGMGAVRVADEVHVELRVEAKLVAEGG
jgi:hypothetical protein